MTTSREKMTATLQAAAQPRPLFAQRGLTHVFDAALCGLVRAHGHEDKMRQFLIGTLDEMTAVDPGRAKDAAFSAALCAAEAKTASADPDRASGYERLESSLACLWKHMMQVDHARSGLAKPHALLLLRQQAETSPALVRRIVELSQSR